MRDRVFDLKKAENEKKIKDFLASPNNRGKRRRTAKAAPNTETIRLNGPSIRAASRKVAKSPEHAEIERKRAIREALLRIKLGALLNECPELEFVLIAGIRNIWALSQAPNSKIRAINGLGPIRRKRIHAYLTSKSVAVTWTP